jgi:hypothetical protein
MQGRSTYSRLIKADPTFDQLLSKNTIKKAVLRDRSTKKPWSPAKTKQVNKMAQKATQQASPIHPMRLGYFPPVYSSSVYYPVQIWNCTTMNPWHMYSPFVYPDSGAPQLYSFWSIDQMVMAEEDTIRNDLYTLVLYWTISILKSRWLTSCLVHILLVRQPSPKGRRHMLETKNCLADGSTLRPDGPTLRPDGPTLRPNGPRSGRSAVVAPTVRACVESVRVPSFSRDLLPKTAELTRKTVWSGSRPLPLYRWRATTDWTPNNRSNQVYFSFLPYALGVALI